MSLDRVRQSLTSMCVCGGEGGEGRGERGEGVAQCSYVVNCHG